MTIPRTEGVENTNPARDRKRRLVVSIEPRLKMGSQVAGLSVAFGLALAACQAIADLAPIADLLPTPIPTAIHEATLPPGASIQGWVWHDLCVAWGGVIDPAATAPPGCTTDAPGGYRANGVFEAGEPGIAGVALQLGDGLCPGSQLADVTTGADGSYRFSGLAAGQYCVYLDPASIANGPLLLPGGWTYPLAVDGVTSISVVLPSEEVSQELNFGWDYQLLPPSLGPEWTPTPQPGLTPTASPTTCVDRAELVTDVSVPDGMHIAPGLSFTKIWRLKNVGTCAWTTGFSVVFISGDRMNGTSLSRSPAASHQTRSSTSSSASRPRRRPGLIAATGCCATWQASPSVWARMVSSLSSLGSWSTPPLGRSPAVGGASIMPTGS